MKHPNLGVHETGSSSIWQFLRQNHLSNRVFDTYTAIVDACCAAWNALIKQPDQITSIASRDWAKQVIV